MQRQPTTDNFVIRSLCTEAMQNNRENDESKSIINIIIINKKQTKGKKRTASIWRAQAQAHRQTK